MTFHINLLQNSTRLVSHIAYITRLLSKRKITAAPHGQRKSAPQNPTNFPKSENLLSVPNKAENESKSTEKYAEIIIQRGREKT